MTTRITHSRLLSLLSYDSGTGYFTWLVRKGRFKPGTRAGRQVSDRGYRRITIDGIDYQEHTLAYFYVHGVWVSGLDHKDRCPAHNWIDNLRPATGSQNSANKVMPINSTGYTGVYPRRSKRYPFYANLKKNGVIHYVGVFVTAKSAARARATLKRRLFGEFAGEGVSSQQ